MKTVLAIWHSSNKGKTETLREFTNLMADTFPTIRIILSPTLPVPEKIDFRCIFEINGRIIGIESQGDPKTNLQNRLLELADNFNCDLILCTSRTRGETVAAVDNLFHNRGFQTIWTSTYQIADNNNHNLVNRIKARHLLDLIQQLTLI